ncbi:MAG: FAD:protein FMN transferase [Allopontixanthobacter sediminis]
MPDEGQQEVEQLLLPPGPMPDFPPHPVGGRTVRLHGGTMGTDWSLEAVAPPEMTDGMLRTALDHVFDRVIAQMSQWDEESDLSRFNHAAPGSRHRLRNEFALVLDCALNIARATSGAFDPTIGGASELWGFGHTAGPCERPSSEEAVGTRKLDWRAVAVSEGGRILLQPGGLKLDFSGIAKGFAVDAGVIALKKLRVDHVLLNIGGELRASGLRQDGLPWWVDLETPPASLAQSARIGLLGWSVATSGNYRRRRAASGQSWGHTIEPESGLPLADDILSVTVLHPGCMQADALATAIMVLGPETGAVFANANAIPARMVTKSEVWESKAWTRWLSP